MANQLLNLNPQQIYAPVNNNLTADEIRRLSGKTHEPKKPKRSRPATQSVAVTEPVGDLDCELKLAKLFRNKYRWADKLGSWMRWTGIVWQQVTLQQVTDKAAQALFREAKKALDQASHPTKDTLHRLQNDLKMACSRARIQAGLDLLSGHDGFFTPIEKWDSNPWLLNTLDGVVDLKTGITHIPSPDYFCTKTFNAHATGKSGCPRWENHLKLCLPNPDVRRNVQRLLGLALTAARLDEKLMFWVGHGCNGKSVTTAALLKLFNDYARQADINLLTVTKYPQHPAVIADLHGRRLVLVSEIERGSLLSETLAKSLTGGDVINAHFMAKDPFNFSPTWQILLAGNHKPRIRSQDRSIWRRIVLVPWTTTIPKNLQRPQDEVVEELLQERDGILRWLMQGLADWNSDHFWIAKAVSTATNKYREDEDVLGEFLATYCEIGKDFQVPFAQLYDRYHAWAESNHMNPLSKKAFRGVLDDREIEVKKFGHDNITTCFGIRSRN